MPWIGPKGEAVPPHPRPEPRFEGDLTADRIRWIFRDSADFGERPAPHRRGPGQGGPPSFSSTAMVRNERMNDYILAPWPPAPCSGRPPPRRPSG